jgi:phenolic acid decarboxylase
MSNPPPDLVGKKLTYEYANGWAFESHFRESTITYRVIGGPHLGRAAYQDVQYEQVAARITMVTWYEETGTVVTLTVNLEGRRVYGSVALPRVVWDNIAETAVSKRENFAKLLAMRDGPDAPRHLVLEVATVTDVAEATTADVSVDQRAPEDPPPAQPLAAVTARS